MSRGAGSDDPADSGGVSPDGGGSERTASASAEGLDEALKTRAMDEAPVGITVADATDPEMPLVYVNAAFERITGYAPASALGRNCRFLQGEATDDEPVERMREAIEAGEPVSVELRNYRKDGEQFWNEVTLAPLRDDAGSVTHYVGFQQDVTRRKRAEREARRRAARVERERAAQKRLLDRLDGVFVDVTEAVTDARSRAELERGVVDRLASTYAGAWIGGYDPAAAAVEPRATAGLPTADEPDAVPVGGGDGDGDDRATPAGAPTAADGDGGAVDAAVTTAVDEGAVRIESDVAAIPLHYGDATYGVVCVYGDAGGEDGFADHERAVLAALGRTVATGINSLESQRTLRADEAVELRFTLRDHPLVDLSDDLDCRLAYVRDVADRDRPSALFELDDVDADAVRAGVAESPLALRAVLFEGTDGCLVELSLPDGGLRDLLADYGADLQSVTATGDTGRFVVEVARESLARSLADTVLDRFDDADLAGYRQRERRPETRREFVSRLEDDLTDRQQSALLRAYTAGFFEWPHEATGEDLAEAMDICRSTFHQHLRAAQRKLIGAVFDRPN